MHVFRRSTLTADAPDSIYVVRGKALTHNPQLRPNSGCDRFRGHGDCDAGKVLEDAFADFWGAPRPHRDARLRRNYPIALFLLISREIYSSKSAAEIPESRNSGDCHAKIQ